MNIRIAELKDIKAIVDIYNQAVKVTQKTCDTEKITVASRRQWFDEHEVDKYPIFVAELDGVVVGYATISAYRPGRKALRFTAEVSYYIHFDYHRQGIASALLQYGIRMCPSLQIKTLFAIIVNSNIASVKLMEKYGFERWGHMPCVADFEGIEVGHLYYGLRV